MFVLCLYVCILCVFLYWCCIYFVCYLYFRLTPVLYFICMFMLTCICVCICVQTFFAFVFPHCTEVQHFAPTLCGMPTATPPRAQIQEENGGLVGGLEPLDINLGSTGGGLAGLVWACVLGLVFGVVRLKHLYRMHAHRCSYHSIVGHVHTTLQHALYTSLIRQPFAQWYRASTFCSGIMFHTNFPYFLPGGLVLILYFPWPTHGWPNVFCLYCFCIWALGPFYRA